MGAKKSLSARVQERAQRFSPAARNRAQVVALRGEIEHALNDGCSLAMIWNTLQEEDTIQFSYETFRAYVRKLVRPLSETHPDSPPIMTRSESGKQRSTGRLMGRAPVPTQTPARLQHPTRRTQNRASPPRRG
ncbi:MAG: TraK family protein [Nitrospira sp.]|nr:TraK family protein [Nitrospira sp.]